MNELLCLVKYYDTTIFKSTARCFHSNASKACLPQFRRIFSETSGFFACYNWAMKMRNAFPTKGVPTMKKVLSAILAALLLVSMSATALAIPDETAAPTDTAQPTGTTAPTETVAPSTTPEPTKQPNPFIEQVKAMRAEVRALRELLKTEKEYDRQVRDQIKAIQGVVKLDTEKVKAYTAQLKELTKKLGQLTKELAKLEKPAKGKKPAVDNSKKINELKQTIQALKDEIAALKAQNQPLVDQVKNSKNGRRSLLPLKQQLKAKYEALKPLVRAAKTLNDEIRQLTVHDLKDALKAGDTEKATLAVEQIRAKIELLKANINARIAIRLEMRAMLDAYKAQLETPPAAN